MKLLFLVCLLLLASNVFATESIQTNEVGASHSVPAEACALAQAILASTWTDIVRDNPSFLGLPADIDETHATLGEPFLVFKLVDDGLGRYMSSADDDPRSFASVVEYCFPIELPGRRDAGTIIIVRNRDDTGHAFVPGDGTVSFSGFHRPDDETPLMIDSLRQSYSSACAVEFVDIALRRYLVADRQGNLLAGQDQSSLKPIANEAGEIRRRIKVLRDSVTTSGEE